MAAVGSAGVGSYAGSGEAFAGSAGASTTIGGAINGNAGATASASGGAINASGGAINASGGAINASGGTMGVQPDPDLPVLNCGATPCSDSAMIVDMESNDGLVCSVSGRSGYVSFFGDGTGTQWPVGSATKFSPLENCRGISAVALHVKGADFRSWGAGVAIHFAASGFNATGFSGLLFWARSSTSTQISIGVVTPGTQDVAYGGTCVPGGGKQCNDHFVTKRTLTPNWVAYLITFGELRQVGWGVPAPTPTIDVTSLIELNIVAPQGQPFDYWLDDITFNI